jgi:hypothetical protein
MQNYRHLSRVGLAPWRNNCHKRQYAAFLRAHFSKYSAGFAVKTNQLLPVADDSRQNAGPAE